MDKHWKNTPSQISQVMGSCTEFLKRNATLYLILIKGLIKLPRHSHHFSFENVGDSFLNKIIYKAL